MNLISLLVNGFARFVIQVVISFVNTSLVRSCLLEYPNSLASSYVPLRLSTPSKHSNSLLSICVYMPIQVMCPLRVKCYICLYRSYVHCGLSVIYAYTGHIPFYGLSV